MQLFDLWSAALVAGYVEEHSILLCRPILASNLSYNIILKNYFHLIELIYD